MKIVDKEVHHIPSADPRSPAEQFRDELAEKQSGGYIRVTESHIRLIGGEMLTKWTCQCSANWRFPIEAPTLPALKLAVEKAMGEV